MDLLDAIEEDEHTIHILCPLGASITPEDIGNLLPAWKTHVISCEVTGALPMLKLVLLIAAKTVEEFQMWLQRYEEKTKCSYSIKATEACSGRYITFKRRLHCIHSTSCSRVYDPTSKNRTRNTNCPSTIYVKILAVKKRYQGKNKDKAPNPELPCRIVLIATHNHIIDSADVLRFRPVSDEVRQTLLELYARGHTPATALESIKMDIRLNYDDCDSILTDRKYCPDYMYCYHLYKKELNKQCNPMELDSDGKNFIMRRLEYFEEEIGDSNSAKMLIDESNYIICICPPMLKQIHKIIKPASEMVFVVSTRTIDNEDSRLFILFAPSECGGLPLGIIITSSEHSEVISKGLELLKDMVGEDIFGGNPNGPVVFLSDDSTAVRSALQKVFVSSTCITCVFHILRTIWRWLINPANEIPQAHQYTFFQQFRAIVYAETIDDCIKKYNAAICNARDYPTYLNCLEDYWKRKEVWAKAYCDSLLVTENKTNMFSEITMRLVKEKVFKKIKNCNATQVVDFILSKFMMYYEKQLLDTVENRIRRSTLDKNIERPPEGIVDRIQILNESIALVPSETTDNLFFMVNIDVLMCTCSDGNLGILCKHIDWVYYLTSLSNSSECTSNIQTCQPFHIVDTEIKPPIDSPIHSYIYEDDADKDEIDEESDLQTVALNAGIENIKIISDILTSFLEQSPHEVNVGLQTMKNELFTLNTPEAIVSACTSFGARFHQKRPKILSRKKLYMSSQSNHVSGKCKNGRVKKKSKALANKFQHHVENINQHT